MWNFTADFPVEFSTLSVLFRVGLLAVLPCVDYGRSTICVDERPVKRLQEGCFSPRKSPTGVWECDMHLFSCLGHILFRCTLELH